MALAAVRVIDLGQYRAPVLDMARGARRRKKLLICVVRRSLMATQAGRVGSVVFETGHAYAVHQADVAEAALIMEKRVRR